MENYDINIYYGKATIEVTIQCWKYKGHYRIETQGNIKGTDILEAAFETDWLENKDVTWNDCKLNIQENLEGDMIFTAELENNEGNILEIDGYMEELKENIVGVQIINYVDLERSENNK